MSPLTTDTPHDQVLEELLADEADGKLTLQLLGWRYGIEDAPKFVAVRRGAYVRLTAAGVRELERVNRTR